MTAIMKFEKLIQKQFAAKAYQNSNFKSLSLLVYYRYFYEGSSRAGCTTSIPQWHRVVNGPLLSPWPFLDGNKRLHISLEGPSPHGQVVQLKVGQLYLLSDVSVFYRSADALGFPSEADTFSHVKVTHSAENRLSSDLLWHIEKQLTRHRLALYCRRLNLRSLHFVTYLLWGQAWSSLLHRVCRPLLPLLKPHSHVFCLRNWIRCESWALDWHMCALLSLCWTGELLPFTSGRTVLFLLRWDAQ